MKVGATTSALLSGEGEGFFLRYSAQGLASQSLEEAGTNGRGRAIGGVGREKLTMPAFRGVKTNSAEIQTDPTK